jgi:nicotinamide-nucleotide amidase
MNSSITPLVQQLAQTLLAKGLKIASAESCTGGLLAAHLTSLAGSSDWFERGFITYSNQAKEESIGVSKELIEQYGAVSEEAAKAMAKGALNHSLAQVSVAITGIAGPGGGGANKPVGMICFAWGVRVDDQIQTRAQTKHFSGDRQSIREQACVYAIESLLMQLTASESR